MVNLKSLSLFVGTSECNANCGHCAGIPLRKYAPKEDGIVDRGLIYRTVRECYDQGARYLSISSSGEPTLSPLSVTKTLELLHECRGEGINFSPINLYSNGIRIGDDESFCDSYLSRWKNLGLSSVYITVHDVDEVENAKFYGVESYPSLDLILSRIHNTDLLMRANLVLSKRAVGTFDKFVSTVEYLRGIGVDSVSAWPIRNNKDEVDFNLSPLEEEFGKMERWARNLDDVRLLGKKNEVVYEAGKKLTLFPNGILSNTWCNN